jgi:integrase
MSGSITKRCSCPPAYSAKGERLACKVKHGSWSLVLSAGKDPQTGRRRQVRESGFPTKDAASKRLAELTDQAAKGGTLPRRRVTFASYSGTWLESRTATVRKNTASNYAAAVAHAVAAFGAKPLTDVARADVERLARQLAATRSKANVAFVLFVVRAVLEQAVDDGSLTRNPAARVAAAGRPSRERQALSADELARLREHFESDRLAGCWLLTLCGLRRSELLGLKWSDVDLSTGELTVDHAVVADPSSAKRSDPTAPKTRRGTRLLPLPPDVLAALRELRERQASELGFEHARTGELVVDESGQPYRPERWSDMWRQHCRDAGIRVVTLHAARHSSVTAMRDAHVPDHIVAAWHGHDEVVMRRTYSHADQDGLAAAGVALSDVLGGKALPMA